MQKGRQETVMGNQNSMSNNMSLLEQRNGLKYSSEFLRYSQIPYENHHHSVNTNPNHLPHHHFKYKERQEQQLLANPVKVLPAINFDQKLKNTNNGNILQSGGTISGRKDSDVSCERLSSLIARL